jgi:integrase
MAVYKDKATNTWRVIYRYTDFTGEVKQSQKRGFATKREALAWERENANVKETNLNMTFASFLEIYTEDVKNRVKENTWLTKEHIFSTKILPYFGKRKINEIQPKDILKWQNEMLNMEGSNGKLLSPSYLKTIHNQLSAVFNHACKFYGLAVNPAAKVGNMGKDQRKDMEIWSKEEYSKFANETMDKPQFFYAFEVLYWTGIREGELLALTPKDFDFEKQTLSITKSYQRIKKRDVITAPKTPKSNRVIRIPDFLVKEIQDYIAQLYAITLEDRLFAVSKNQLTREMARASKAAGVKKIRIHDLRHTHISQLIEMGFSAVAIGDRVGHESVEITYRYAHLFPTTQTQMATQLNTMRGGMENVS